MKKKWPLLWAVLPLLTFGAVWLALLPFHEPIAEWCSLTVEEPLISGSNARLTVRVIGIEDAAVLSTDLHWYGKKREYRGYLTGSNRILIPRGKSAHAISIPIKEADDLGYVSVVIYLSPNGRWRDRTLAAHSELIRLWGNEADRPEVRFVNRKCYVLAAGDTAAEPGTGEGEGRSCSAPPLDQPRPIVTALPYYFAGLLCVLCGALSLASLPARARRSAAQTRQPESAPRNDEPESAPRLHPWWWLFLGAFTASQGFLKQAHFASEVTGWVRNLFIARHLYFHHQSIQKLVISGLAAALAVAAANARRIIPKHLSLYLNLALYGVIASSCLSLLRTISYHYADALLERRLFELPFPERPFQGHALGNLTIYTLVELLISGFVALSAILHLAGRKHKNLQS
jgi:hypothetical protein